MQFWSWRKEAEFKDRKLRRSLIPFINSGTSGFGLIPVFATLVKGPKVSLKRKQVRRWKEGRTRSVFGLTHRKRLSV